MAGTLTTQTLNGFTVPQDIFLKNNKGSPIILTSLTVHKDITVEGSIQNISTINDMNLWNLNKLLDDFSEDTLYVENAYFSKGIPLYKTLNKHNIRQTLDKAWLSNENVILHHHVELADVFFDGLLEFEVIENRLSFFFS